MQIFSEVLLTVLTAAVTGAGIMSARLRCYKKQINHIISELDFIKNRDTNYLLTSARSIGRTQEMIDLYNQIMEDYREKDRRLVSENTVYRESITSISHDIRTPLTSAKGYLQMLQGSVPEEKREEYIKIVEQRLDHVTDMLNQLFEYARIEAGEMEFEPEEFNAVNVFAETVSLFYNDFSKKGCEPEVLLPSAPCLLYADKNAFVRITENLIKNALVHGTGGYCFSLSQESGWIKICVSNLTDSIEKQDIDRIFDRFYTTDKSRSRKTTGLGLAIVKRFTERMGGRAGAKLENGRFTVELLFREKQNDL